MNWSKASYQSSCRVIVILPDYVLFAHVKAVTAMSAFLIQYEAGTYK